MEGFTVQNFAQNGITIFPSANGAEVVDNTVDASSTSQSPSAAINADDGGADGILIKNNDLGYGEDNAIYLLDNSNVIVEGNTISDAEGQAESFAIGIGHNGGTNISITENTISTDAVGNGIQAESDSGSLDDLSISSNDISIRGTGSGGVLISKGSGTVTGVSINQNNLADSEYGLTTSGDPATVDATNNWWGSADGPSGDGSGSGALVFGDVDFDPFADQSFDDAGADD